MIYGYVSVYVYVIVHVYIYITFIYIYNYSIYTCTKFCGMGLVLLDCGPPQASPSQPMSWAFGDPRLRWRLQSARVGIGRTSPVPTLPTQCPQCNLRGFRKPQLSNCQQHQTDAGNWSKIVRCCQHLPIPSASGASEWEVQYWWCWHPTQRSISIQAPCSRWRCLQTARESNTKMFQHLDVKSFGGSADLTNTVHTIFWRRQPQPDCQRNKALCALLLVIWCVMAWFYEAASRRRRRLPMASHAMPIRKLRSADMKTFWLY